MAINLNQFDDEIQRKIEQARSQGFSDQEIEQRAFTAQQGRGGLKKEPGFVSKVVKGFTQPFVTTGKNIGGAGFEVGRAAGVAGGQNPFLSQQELSQFSEDPQQALLKQLKASAGVGAFAVPGGKAFQGLARGSQLGGAALSGAASGALAGFGAGKGQTGGEIARDVGTGALAGGVTGGALNLAGRGLQKVGRGLTSGGKSLQRTTPIAGSKVVEKAGVKGQQKIDELINFADEIGLSGKKGVEQRAALNKFYNKTASALDDTLKIRGQVVTFSKNQIDDLVDEAISKSGLADDVINSKSVQNEIIRVKNLLGKKTVGGAVKATDINRTVFQLQGELQSMFKRARITPIQNKEKVLAPIELSLKGLLGDWSDDFGNGQYRQVMTQLAKAHQIAPSVRKAALQGSEVSLGKLGIVRVPIPNQLGQSARINIGKKAAGAGGVLQGLQGKEKIINTGDDLVDDVFNQAFNKLSNTPGIPQKSIEGLQQSATTNADEFIRALGDTPAFRETVKKLPASQARQVIERVDDIFTQFEEVATAGGTALNVAGGTSKGRFAGTGGLLEQIAGRTPLQEARTLLPTTVSTGQVPAIAAGQAAVGATTPSKAAGQVQGAQAVDGQVLGTDDGGGQFFQDQQSGQYFSNDQKWAWSGSQWVPNTQQVASASGLGGGVAGGGGGQQQGIGAGGIGLNSQQLQQLVFNALRSGDPDALGFVSKFIDAATKAQKLAGTGKPKLSANAQTAVAQGQSTLGLLDEVGRQFSEVQDIGFAATGGGVGQFGAVRGRVGATALFQNPVARSFEQSKEGLLSFLSRGFGEKGTLGQQDVERIRKLLPVFEDSPETARRKLKSAKQIIQNNIDSTINTASQSTTSTGLEDFLQGGSVQ